MSNLLDLVKSKQMRADLPEMHPGDTVRVHARIVEGNKERVQVFEGVIIRLRRAQNASSITVRRISHGSIGVERTFLLHSPRIDRFEVVRRGKVRRAKLYYLRDRQGKSARIKELRPTRQAAASRAPAQAAPPVAPAAEERAPAASEAPAEMATVE
jgi:large subunit ribosomal protein L19